MQIKLLSDAEPESLQCYNRQRKEKSLLLGKVAFERVSKDVRVRGAGDVGVMLCIPSPQA